MLWLQKLVFLILQIFAAKHVAKASHYSIEMLLRSNILATITICASVTKIEQGMERETLIKRISTLQEHPVGRILQLNGLTFQHHICLLQLVYRTNSELNGLWADVA